MSPTRWRTAITLVALLVVVGGTAWYGWQQLSVPGTGTNPFAGQPRCVDERIAEGDRLRARQVTVNVYNAGNSDGLAGETLRALGRKRFVTGTAENAPTRISVRAVSIFDAEPRSAEVRLVREQFRGRVQLRGRPDIADGVDVVVGSDFRGVDPQAPRSIRLANSEQVCVPAPG